MFYMEFATYMAPSRITTRRLVIGNSCRRNDGLLAIVANHEHHQRVALAALFQALPAPIVAK